MSILYCFLFTKKSIISNPLCCRYYAVCKPLTFANSYSRARILIIGSIVSGIVLSIPLLVFYGHKTVWFDIPGTPRGPLPGDDFFTPINTSAGLNYLNRTEEMTTQAMTAFMFLSSENATFQNRNFTRRCRIAESRSFRISRFAITVTNTMAACHRYYERYLFLLTSLNRLMEMEVDVS